MVQWSPLVVDMVVVVLGPNLVAMVDQVVVVV
jgi:hypothetical protein